MPIVQIPVEYGWNILAATGLAFHCIITGFRAGGQRKKFNIPYPDMGNGRYAAKLTDDQWKTFNNYQRTHYNYLESVASIITLQLLGGLFYPKYVAGLGAAYIVGRELYNIGYTSKGPNGRIFGALILNIALFAKLGFTVVGALKLLGYM